MSDNKYFPNSSQIFLFADEHIRNSLTQEKLLENNIVNKSSNIKSNSSDFEGRPVNVFNIDKDYVLHVADGLVVVDCRKDDNEGRNWLIETSQKIIQLFPNYDYKGIGVSLHFSIDSKILKNRIDFINNENKSSTRLVHNEPSINNSLLIMIIEEEANRSNLTFRYHHDIPSSKAKNNECSRLLNLFDLYVKDFNVRIGNIHNVNSLN